MAARTGDTFTSLAQRPLMRDSAFAYDCHRCTRCCSEYRIPLGPFDLLLLSRQLHLTTTDFIHQHMADGLYLRRRDDGSCEFLNEQGCSVHAGRPLVCRIYPLGRNVAQGQESFSAMTPVAGSAGVWGASRTVQHYLEQQGALASIEGVELYLELHAQLLQRLQDAPPQAQEVMLGVCSEFGAGAIAPLGLLDPDATVERYCAQQGLPQPLELMDKARCHALALHAWMDTQLEQMT